MKILFVNGHLHVGGVEKSLINLLKSLDYKENQVDLLLLEGIGEYYTEIPPQVNVILYDLHPTYGSFLKVMKRALSEKDYQKALIKIILTLSSRIDLRFLSLLRFLRISDIQYDCAIAYRVGICADYVGYVIKSPKKYMWWHHGEFDYSVNTVKRWRKMLTHMNKVICVSTATKDMLLEYYPEKNDNIDVVPNIIDCSELIKKSMDTSPYKNDIPIHIITLGRLSPEKHVENVIPAAKMLVENGISFQWHIVGDGTERIMLENLVKREKVEDVVIFEGSQTNPYPYIANATLMAHPSYVESQGLVVLEALALGIPCVVTKSRGPLEYIEDGVNGILTEQNSADFAEKVLHTLTDRVLYEQIKKHTYCPTQFENKSIIRKVEQLLD